jgi:hypothetical protein
MDPIPAVQTLENFEQMIAGQRLTLGDAFPSDAKPILYGNITKTAIY